MKKNQFVFYFFVLIGVGLTSLESTEKNDKSVICSMRQLQTLFKNPPVEYRSAPLWVWNDDVNEQQIDQQLADFKAVGIGGVFIHPRPGLITPYLSDKWFSLCRYTVKKGKELGMNVWLYDENSYPSGFAGGHVPAEMPESYNQGQGLVLKQVEELPENSQFKIHNGKTFERLEQRRKRIKCFCIDNKKLYLFDPLTKVFPLTPNETD